MIPPQAELYMRKILCAACLSALFLTLSACGGGGEKAEFSPTDDARTLLDSPGVFGEALTEIDQSTACALYGIEETTVTESAVYGSTSSAEELAIFTFSDETSAQAAAQQFTYRVEDRRDELENYLPDELPKLDSAIVEVRGNSALLVIAADYGPVDVFLGN